MQFQLSAQKLSSQALKWRYFSLSCVSSPLVGSYLLAHTPAHLPGKCLILSLMGIPCPSCGMTRSFVAIARGNIIESLSYHGLGIFVFISFILLAIHLSIEVVTRRSLSSSFHRRLSHHKVPLAIGFLIVLFSYYGVRLAAFFKTGEFIPDVAF